MNFTVASENLSAVSFRRKATLPPPPPREFLSLYFTQFPPPSIVSELARSPSALVSPFGLVSFLSSRTQSPPPSRFYSRFSFFLFSAVSKTLSCVFGARRFGPFLSRVHRLEILALAFSRSVLRVAFQPPLFSRSFPHASRSSLSSRTARISLRFLLPPFLSPPCDFSLSLSLSLAFSSFISSSLLVLPQLVYPFSPPFALSILPFYLPSPTALRAIPSLSL